MLKEKSLVENCSILPALRYAAFTFKIPYLKPNEGRTPKLASVSPLIFVHPKLFSLGVIMSGSSIVATPIPRLTNGLNPFFIKK